MKRFKVITLAAAALSLSLAAVGIAGLEGGSDYSLRYTIDGGSGYMLGSTYELRGTVGQPDTGVWSGAGYTLSGGFWAAGEPFDPCPEDLDGDDLVAVTDLLALLGAWGCTGCPEDLSGDGTVNTVDLLQLLGGWGSCS